MTNFLTRRHALTGALAAATAVLIAGCSSPETPAKDEAAKPAGELLADFGFEGKSAKDIITELDELPVAQRSTQLMASIRPDELILMDAAKREVALPMPKDEFYVSVAPYVKQTHDCHFHSLTTCQGEMQNQDMDVTVTDSKTGEVVVKETMRTFDNGFLGLWLPRGIEATLTMSHDGKSVTQPLSTKASDDATCVTTTKLS